MINKKNQRHKDNRKKKKMDFENKKATFVAGIAVVLTVINDTIGLLVSVPLFVECIEVIICLLLFYLALGTKKMDKLLNKTGVEKAGNFLTVYSIVVFLLERIILRAVNEEVITLSIFNNKLNAFIMFLAFAIVGIGGTIYLVVCKYPKK